MKNKVANLFIIIIVYTLLGCSSDGGDNGGGSGGNPTPATTKASNDSVITDVDTPVNINILQNDTVVSGSTLSIISITQGANGSVITNSNNTVTYTPNTGFSGSDSFTYTISDENGDTSTATVTITVSPIISGIGPYLAYEVGSNIYAVDKYDPANKPLITADLRDATGLNHTDTGTFLVQGLTLDTALSTATLGEPEMLVFVGTTKFWKVDMSQNSNLIPEPLMTETYNNLCKVEFEADALTLEHSLLFYELPGVDDDCFNTIDNTRWMMRVAKSQIYAAVEITMVTDVTKNFQDIITVMDIETNNELLGFIAIKGSEIRHYNTDFVNYSVIMTSVDISSSATRLDISGLDKSGGFLQIDNIVYWYDFQNKFLSAALHIMGTDMVSSQMECDAAECFFHNSASTGSLDEFVYKIPADGSGAASLLAIVSGGFGSSYSDIITPDFIYVAKGDGALISIARSDGNIALVDTEVGFFFGSGQNLYYNRGDTAVIRTNSGGLVNEFSNASWVGLNYVGFKINEVTIGHLILVQKAMGETSFSGALLQSYDPATNQKNVNIGILPVNTTNIFTLGFGTGGMMGYIRTSTEPSTSPDLIWFNPTLVDSLVRLTDDSQREIISGVKF